MPKAADVKPKKWSQLVVIFDNGRYSVVSGNYNGEYNGEPLCLGERWNGRNGKLGFPSQGEYPTYHVVPEFLRLPILIGVYQELKRERDIPNWGEYLKAVLAELEKQGKVNYDQ